ncbi:hypothetical protein [Burkholderia pseudomultivorans]|uniref:hypothetical protein n=1 Tax=Burkholderia pseudomultivorans TaxID=1207504 RepID=UPI0007560BAC|nr:hypothetical protein [Burkholderia pseudomultivorans]
MNDQQQSCADALMSRAKRLIQRVASAQLAVAELPPGMPRTEVSDTIDEARAFARDVIASYPVSHPAAPEPCAHDYVRKDLVCTECGENVATSANETGAEGLQADSIEAGRELYERLHARMPAWYPEAWEDLLPQYHRAYTDAALSRSPTTAPAAPALPIELSSVAETVAEGAGFWRSCSGCHETNEGHETGHYPYSKILKCHLGGGCSECGGIGAVWDDTDYEAMGRDFERSLVAPSHSPAVAAAAPADQRAAYREALAIIGRGESESSAELATVWSAGVEFERARAAASPAAEAAPFKISAKAAEEWAVRHFLDHVLKNTSTQRAAIEDARTLHLIDAPQPAQADAPAAAREPMAWVTPEGDRAITQLQKQKMMRSGGAGATSVHLYSVPCYSGRASADLH